MRAVLFSVLLALLLVSGLLLSLPNSTLAQAQSTNLDFPSEENWNIVVGSLNLSRGVYALAFDQNYLYLGEGFGDGNKHIRRWDGIAWSSIATNLDQPVHALLTTSDGSLYAGGNFSQIEQCTQCKRIGRWYENQWSSLGGGLSETVNALAQDSHQNLFAGGTFGILSFKGSNWITESTTGTVFVLFSNGNLLYAGGQNFKINEDNDDRIYFPLLMAKENASWIDLGNQFTYSNDSGIYGLTIYPPEYFTPTVGGDFIEPPKYLVSWSEQSGWTSLGNPDNRVNTLASDSCGGLYVGGDFKKIGNKNISLIAYWDGTTWYSLTNTIRSDEYSYVKTLAFYHGYLAVGGVFTQTLDGNNHRNIALWTGRDCAQITASGTYTFYNWREPVAIKIGEQGNLAQIRVQQFNKDHPEIDETTTPNLTNGVYWQIEGLAANGQPASGISYTLTLPAVSFIPDAKDKICHYLGNAKWDCAASSYDPEEKTISRAGLTAFSEFTVGNDVGPTVVGLQLLRTRQAEFPLLTFVLIFLSAVGLVYLQKKKL